MYEAEIYLTCFKSHNLNLSCYNMPNVRIMKSMYGKANLDQSKHKVKRSQKNVSMESKKLIQMTDYAKICLFYWLLEKKSSQQ